jgi:hypothetical protein
MQEQMPATEIPVHADGPAGGARSAGGNPALDDPRALQILSTEHWSLLASRSLSYNETFARAGMFLTFLGASLVALGLIASATGFTPQLALVSAVVLATDLFVGLATLGRILDASHEEMSCVAGMNRIRHAYREMVPGIEPYFSTPFHDDVMSVLAAYGLPEGATTPLQNLVHGFTTAPAMVGVVVAIVGGALVSTIALGLGVGSEIAFLGGVAGFAVVFGLGTWYAWSRTITSTQARTVRFPAPPANDA